MNLLKDNVHINYRNYGWNEASDGCIVPDKVLQPLPFHYTVKCGCKTGCSGRCKFVRLGVQCTDFCKYKGNCDRK